MRTLEEFKTLSYDEKLLTVVDEGLFLDNYVTKDVRINLYSISRFYVELFYSSELNKVVEIRSFESGKSLDKYASDIDLM